MKILLILPLLLSGCCTPKTITLIPIVEMVIVTDSCADRPAPMNCT